MKMPTLSLRPRRMRQTQSLRDLVSENSLTKNDLIYPLFIHAGENIKTPILSMPGCYQYSCDRLEEELAQVVALGIPAVILFGIPAYKDETGSEALSGNSVIAQAIEVIKARTPELLVISDLCFCEYTSHGHCGILYKKSNGMVDVDNDATLAALAKQAVIHARAGADIIAPSGMMDNMVAVIRRGLDNAGFSDRPILSYAVKYASHFYGPFREAAQGAPQFGDRKTYQMNPANAREALQEAAQDVAQGTDMLMVKPAMNYLDIIYQIKKQFPSIPLGAYQVSGEYAMIKAAAQNGWLDEEKVMLESLVGIKRAGADFIITYFAKEAAKLI